MSSPATLTPNEQRILRYEVYFLEQAIIALREDKVDRMPLRLENIDDKLKSLWEFVFKHTPDSESSEAAA